MCCAFRVGIQTLLISVVIQGTVSFFSRDGCEWKSQVMSSLWNGQTNPTGTNHIEKSVKSLFFPNSNVQFELLQVVFTTSTCQIAESLPCDWLIIGGKHVNMAFCRLRDSEYSDNKAHIEMWALLSPLPSSSPSCSVDRCRIEMLMSAIIEGTLWSVSFRAISLLPLPFASCKIGSMFFCLSLSSIQSRADSCFCFIS